MRKFLRIDVLVAALSVLVLAACLKQVTNVDTDVDQGQGQEVGGPTPTASPAAPQCELASIIPGTANDAKTIAQGGVLEIGVSLIGKQGQELVESCLSQYSPVWLSAAGPCSYTGSHSGEAYAPSTATVGTTCLANVKVGTLTGALSLRVVEALPALRARTLDGDPEPEPSPTPTPDDLGVIDR